MYNVPEYIHLSLVLGKYLDTTCLKLSLWKLFSAVTLFNVISGRIINLDVIEEVVLLTRFLQIQLSLKFVIFYHLLGCYLNTNV